MLKSVIVEDETRSRLMLQSLLKDFCTDVVVAGSTDSVNSAYDIIMKTNPDLIFLDVELQSETGFALLEKFDQINFEIIFTTAYEQYALRAIKFCAIDYLLKPIDVSELKAAVEKVRKRKADQTPNSNLQILKQNLKNNSSEQQLCITTAREMFIIKVAEICYCESDGPYTTFFLNNGKTIVTSKTLKEYEELLVQHDFFRVHRSYLINMNEIKKYMRGENAYLIMNNGTQIDVSRRKKEDFVKRFRNDD